MGLVFSTSSGCPGHSTLMNPMTSLRRREALPPRADVIASTTEPPPQVRAVTTSCSAPLDDCWCVEVGGHLRGAVGHGHEHGVAAIGAPDQHGREDGHEQAAVTRLHVVAPAVVERIVVDAVVLDERPVVADESTVCARSR